ncbi:MAG: GNAT family N-acetyltransferase [Acidimicrobiia bacterium]
MTNAISTSFVSCDDARWHDIVGEIPHDVYATPPFVRIESARLDAEATGLVIERGDRIMFVPLLLRSIPIGSSAHFDAVSPYGYPGVVVSDAGASDPEFIGDAARALSAALRERGVVSVFLRMHPLLDRHIVESGAFPVVDNGVTVSIDTRKDDVELWAGMSKGHTNAIHKARRAGYEMEIGGDRRHVEEFMVVYRETMTRIGSAITSDFEPAYLEELASLEQAHVAVARLDGEIAGAYLFYATGPIGQMHLGGTRSAFMKPSPSHFLIHAVALWCRERGLHRLHLGGGVGGSANDSLFTFKAGFSPDRHRFATARIVTDPGAYDDLVTARADELQCQPGDLHDSGFFPAYRAAASTHG